MTVKCFKLVTGEEIVSKYEESETHVTLKNPTGIMYAGQGKAGFVPFPTFASGKPEDIVLNKKVIAYTYETNLDVLEHYEKLTSSIVLPKKEELILG